MAGQDNEKNLTVEELLRKKEEEERKRRAEEVKFKQDAIYWEEFTEDVVEHNEAVQKERIEEFEKNVEIEHERIKEAAKETGTVLADGGAAVLKGGVAVGGAVLGATGAAVGAVVDAVKDAVSDEDGISVNEIFNGNTPASENAENKEAGTNEPVNNHGVEPLAEDLPENAELTPELMAKENDVMKLGQDTLNAAMEGAEKVSDEYKAVLDSLGGVQASLTKEYENPADAKKEYVKNIHKVLNNINRYRVSMAGKDGEIDEATKKQIIGLEKVDSLLRGRYQALEQREYEDTIGDVAELFKVEADENAVGDEYLLQQGLGKIANMKKQIEDFREEIKEGKTVVENPDELGMLIDNPLEREVLAADPAEKEAEPVRVEDEHLTEQRDIEKERREKEKKEIEEGDLKNEKVEDKKLEEEVGTLKVAPAERREEAAPKKNTEKIIEENVKELYGNVSLQAAIEKEAEYRRGMDPNDEYGKTQIALSAKKSLYLEVLEQGAAKRVKDLGQEKVDDILDRGLKDFNKSAIKARAFMAEYVGDKDFNREFGKRVLEGAKNGKVEQEQIRTFRDEALTACYKELPGKDLKALDKLSEMLGSNVNSKTLNLKKDKVLEKKMDEEQEKKIEHKLGGPKPLGLGR